MLTKNTATPPTLHTRGKLSEPLYLPYFLRDELNNLIFSHCKMKLESRATAATWGPDCLVALAQSLVVVSTVYTRKLLEPMLSP